MPKPNTDPLYVSRRKIAMVKAGVRQKDLVARWDISAGMANQMVSGVSRSHEKELDFAKLVGCEHSYLFAAAKQVHEG